METYKNGVEDLALLTYPTCASFTKGQEAEDGNSCLYHSISVAPILGNGILVRLI